MLRPQLQAANGGPSAAGSAVFEYRAAVLPRRWAAGSLPCDVCRPVQGGRVGGGRKGSAGGVRCTFKEVQTAVTRTQESSTKVKAVVTVKLTVGGLLAKVGLTNRGLESLGDIITDLVGKSLFLELVSAELDPETGEEKRAVGSFVHSAKREGDVQKYEGEVTVPKGFGEIGALLVTNEHHREMFLQDVVLSGIGDNDDDAPLTFSCHSWVHAKSDDPRKRVFFSDKSYLPCQTPDGLQRLREEELQVLRGDGRGERQRFERIYDYDVYNDLGDPDSSEDMARPVLGGHELPYPRRCRTGRPRTKKDPHSEKRSIFVYVPRDEFFSEVKGVTFSAKTLRSVLHALIPSLETALSDPELGFPLFTRIDALFNQGLDLPLPQQQQDGLLGTVLPRLVKAVSEGKDNVLLFEPPAVLHRDKFSWIRDEEFSRQALAGVNPLSIQLVTEFPFVSKLDPEIYGPPESEITKEILERGMKGTVTVEQAIEEKRLFMIDYHDLLLPYVNKVRELPGTTLYGSRTVFFLTDGGVLTPIAIELTRPKSPTKPQWKQVFTHTHDATGSWLWRLAKTHVAAHDSSYHELVIHWLRTHGCTEPYIIATNRQLSVMHPIQRLLHPHFRYTMEINALAREALINAGGTIETCFSPGEYSMELSSVAYDKLWRFDHQALPADLISRGMAVEDPTAEHGLRLTIEDYPFAADGLLIWSAIERWVEDYVTHYYADADDIESDGELQAWWEEIRTKGHADKKDEPWWPKLETPADLVGILTTVIWVASGHHAAVNFGQYHYGGYFPNRPTIARTNMPAEEGNEREFRRFLEKPEEVLLECLPTQIQATRVMAVLDVLSTHNPDEEYIGDLPPEIWDSDKVIRAAYESFNGRLKEIEGIIDARNLDTELKNRCGAGIVPYELLKPFSKPGVTGMGVPNSISI